MVSSILYKNLLKCEVHESQVQWFYNGEQIFKSNQEFRRVKIQGTNDENLAILDFNVHNTGIYTCKAVRKTRPGVQKTSMSNSVYMTSNFSTTLTIFLILFLASVSILGIFLFVLGRKDEKPTWIEKEEKPTIL